MGKHGGYNVPWTQKEIDTAIELYKENKTNFEIGSAIGKTQYAVKTKLGKLRKQFDLPPRIQSILNEAYKRRPNDPSPFDKEWHGPVPCGHWMITKPWRL